MLNRCSPHHFNCRTDCKTPGRPNVPPGSSVSACISWDTGRPYPCVSPMKLHGEVWEGGVWKVGSGKVGQSDGVTFWLTSTYTLWRLPHAWGCTRLGWYHFPSYRGKVAHGTSYLQIFCFYYPLKNWSSRMVVVMKNKNPSSDLSAAFSISPSMDNLQDVLSWVFSPNGV